MVKQPKICLPCCRIVSWDVVRAWRSHERRAPWYLRMWGYIA
jgi:hypothetical protein